jgi:hypothetical protein
MACGYLYATASYSANPTTVDFRYNTANSQATTIGDAGPSACLTSCVNNNLGFNVHAKVALDGRDRERVERLCRYLGRPPIARAASSSWPTGGCATP